MTALPLGIRLGEEGSSIGSIPLVPRSQTISDLTRLLGAPDRVVPLSHNNTVYIYDQLGIRFWAKAQVVGELQFVFETSEEETLPTHAFVGPLAYGSYLVTPPLSARLLTSGELPGFVQNTDALHYKMRIFCATAAGFKYTAIVNEATGYVSSISVV